MACVTNKNPLIHGGTSQDQRLLNEMKRGYVSIEERDFADWIVFAAKFSAYIKYYDLENKVSNNWQPFFESDISAILGSVAVQNLDEYKLEIKSRFDILKDNESHINIKKECLGALISGILTLSKAFDFYSLKLPDDNQLKINIRNLIHVKLQQPLHKLLSYYKAGKKAGLIREENHPEWKVIGIPVRKASLILQDGLSSTWFSSGTSWADFYSAIPEDNSIYGDSAANPARKIIHAANHNLFRGVFDQFLMSYARVLKDSENALIQSLTTLNNHSPDYTLFLSFLHLFRYSKEHINKLTESHSDFYYKDVLQIKPQSETPNKAHVLIELAKQTDSLLLNKGILLKAGKDSLGKEVFYAIDNDVVFNKARVAQLKSVYRATVSDNYSSINHTGRIFASPVINSADGLGAEIETEFKEWHPYINKDSVDGIITNIRMPKAQIGFSVASSNLFLTEGERIIHVKFAPAFTSGQLAALDSIECYLTTEKGWYKVSNQAWSTGAITGPINVSILTLKIPGDVVGITNYNKAVHGGLFNCNTPVLKIYLSNSEDAVYKYDLLKDIKISHIEIEVKVGLDTNDVIINGGLKSLLLSNDFGELDPSKPFQPFGPAPKSGASLVIGNHELFKKKAKIFFKVGWKDLPATTRAIDYESAAPATDTSPRVNLFSLEKGVWKNSGVELSILSDSDVSSPASVITFPSAFYQLSDHVLTEYGDSYGSYNINSNKGFLKLTLKDGFGHTAYQKQLTLYLIDKARTTPAGLTEPTEPYTPLIESLSLHYKAAVSSEISDAGDYEGRELQFYHLYPFGEAEQHSALSGESEIPLLPHFAGDNENKGELYLGIENLQTGQGVSLLFQVLEGTSNPLLDKPERHVTWNYLSDNIWKKFSDQSVTDYTGQLVQSGIISFVIPADAGTENTILDPGYIWLRAAVEEQAEAVCKILSVDAQAAVVTFVPNNNAPDLQNTALPAGSISRLKEASSAIKKIKQPYPSFGGRSAETSEQYFTRVSERLRHKSRAITIWDYEHLILEAFPSIHKVKCLNHTMYSGSDYNELAPGHVTIITIPDLINRNDTNPLRPYTNQNILEQIETFLKKKISCHVKLDVRHPQFEEVRLEFKLKLFNGLEFNYYSELLQREITEFLTPWAYGKVTDIVLGGKVHKSVLINFIEERSYVDYITEVKMFHRVDEGLSESSDTDTIEASTARSVLVSAPSSKHIIYDLA